MTFVTLKETGDQPPHIKIVVDSGLKFVPPKISYMNEQDLDNPLIVWSIFQAKNMPTNYTNKVRDMDKNLRESITKFIEDYEIDFPLDVEKLVRDSFIYVCLILPYEGDFFGCKKMEVYYRGVPVQFDGYDEEVVVRALADEYRS